MLILDKRLNLVGYSFEGYLSSKVTQTTFLDLSAIEAGKCQDLKNVAMNDSDQFLVAFCASQRMLGDSQDSFQSNVTIIQIRNWEDATPEVM